MVEINLLDKYPKSKRPIEERGNLITEQHRTIARQFGQDFFDGDRLYGYGGYNYHPRFWQETVKRFRDYYQLPENAKILDVGCGKGFMLYDFKQLMPQSTIAGLDISDYAILNAKPEVKSYLEVGNAKPLTECQQALGEIQRVTRQSAFVTMDAWRNDQEKENLLKWNLTAKTYMHVDEWVELFQDVGYQGDYYWFIAE